LNPARQLVAMRLHQVFASATAPSQRISAEATASPGWAG
jgi:hypothetical protein